MGELGELGELGWGGGGVAEEDDVSTGGTLNSTNNNTRRCMHVQRSGGNALTSMAFANSRTSAGSNSTEWQQSMKAWRRLSKLALSATVLLPSSS